MCEEKINASQFYLLNITNIERWKIFGYEFLNEVLSKGLGFKDLSSQHYNY